MHLKNVRYTLLFAMLLVLGVGCEKAIVEIPSNSDVTFVMDWSSVKSSDQVKTATVYLYAKSGVQQPIVLKGISSEKTTAEVPEGTYRVVVYNDNLQQIKMRNDESCATFEAYLMPDARLDVEMFNSAGYSIQTSIPSVESLHLLTGTANRELVVEGGKSFSFTLRPKTATLSFRFTVRIPSRLEFSQVNAVLGGIASRMSLFEAKPMSGDISSVDLALTTTLNATKDTIIGQGTVEVFGVDPVNRDQWSNTLYLHLVPRLDDPNVLKDFKIDLTDFFNKYSNKNLDIDVKVDNPNPNDPTDVVFEITVKPWIIEDGGHIDIEPNETNSNLFGGHQLNYVVDNMML